MAKPDTMFGALNFLTGEGDVHGVTTLAEARIVGLDVGPDEAMLRFRTTDGNVYAIAEGDCCSQSWFADIVGIDELVNAIVTHVAFDPMEPEPPQDARCRQEHDRFYGFIFKTTRGSCRFVFRNSSNGYYGGQVDFMRVGSEAVSTFSRRKLDDADVDVEWRDLSKLHEWSA